MPALLRIDRPAAGEFNPYFGRYIDLVTADDALEPLAANIETTAALLGGLSDEKARYRYAPGKWSIKEVAVHMADCERVFTYRALTFARNDKSPLPGFEENEWAPMSGADARSISDIVTELRTIRAATIALFAGLDREALLRIGTANGSPMSVRGAAWCIVGHELHHQRILREKYGLGG